MVKAKVRADSRFPVTIDDEYEAISMTWEEWNRIKEEVDAGWWKYFNERMVGEMREWDEKTKETAD